MGRERRVEIQLCSSRMFRSWANGFCVSILDGVAQRVAFIERFCA